MKNVDVAVVGAGIVGLATAWEAAERGYSVAVFERGPAAQLASIRNFGMIWPIGQTAGEWYDRAMRSRAKWLRLRDEAGLWVNECGSIHAAYRSDEFDVLEDFAKLAKNQGISCELLTGKETLHRYPALKSEGLKGSLFSPTELCVDPRQAISLLPSFLGERYGVQFYFNTPVRSIDRPMLTTATGEEWIAERSFVCGGTDFETLFPEIYSESGLQKCKLQMMATGPQPNGWRLGTHLAGGLTLCHYPSFKLCSTLPKLQERIAEEFPEYVRYGIHVMASQNGLGEVIIGDSHEYDAEISPFDKPEIEELILKYLGTMLELPNPAIARRWHGVYAKHPTLPQFTCEPQPGCTIMASPGGAGMTLSFGCARDWWEEREPTGPKS